MIRREHILVFVEECEAMRRVIDYVGTMIGERSPIAVHLFHRLPSLPPQLREHGGSEDYEREQQLREELERDVHRWVSEQREKCRPVLDQARDRLIGAGVSADAIHMKIEKSAFADEELGYALYYTANELGCRTIVLAREYAPAIRDVFRNRTGDQAESTMLAVWLVD